MALWLCATSNSKTQVCEKGLADGCLKSNIACRIIEVIESIFLWCSRTPSSDDQHQQSCNAPRCRLSYYKV